MRLPRPPGGNPAGFSSFGLLYTLLFLSPLQLVHAASSSSTPLIKSFYRPSDPIPIQCLNRTIDTGEHVADDKGVLQYIPFPVCNETGLPLSIGFMEEGEKNCTLSEVADELFHLFEFYVHADSPMSCRVAGRPVGGERELEMGIKGATEQAEEWVPLVISLSGKIELSHIHIANNLNMIFHISPPPPKGRKSLGGSSSEIYTGPSIDSAAAYSRSPLSTQKIIIGSPLILRFSIHWFPTPSLPKSSEIKWGSKDGEHVTIHTILYCMLTALGTAVCCAVYFRGWEMPKRLRRFDFDRGGGGGNVYGGGNGAGYGYGYGPQVGGYGYGGRFGGGETGKKD